MYQKKYCGYKGECEMANELERAINNYKKNMDSNRKGDADCYDSFFIYCE